ncbi:50S ribosomal protein L16 [Candidatus Pacearchaeota archaeon]|nr:50S ribosomal protein L16 [Candidatus Pacearchaeota archaeon]
MALRKALAYSKKPARPYTRNSRSKSKAYIKTVPGQKIVKFHMGSQKDYMEGKHPFVMSLIAEEGVQIRDNSIEASRMLLNKVLDEQAPGQFYFAVKVFPHHLQRENKSAGGMAGADRISTGMTQSFGIVIGRAAIVRPGQQLFFISCQNEKAAKIARDALATVRSKVPCKTRITFEKVA